MNRLERYAVAKKQIQITLITPEGFPENGRKVAVVTQPGAEDNNPFRVPLTLHALREGMRRLPPTTFGITPLKELQGYTIREKYLEISEEARKLTKQDTGGFDFFKFIYNRLEQIEDHYVSEPRLVFIYFHDQPQESDFYIHRVAMKLHLRPEQLQTELREIKKMSTVEPTSSIQSA